MTSDNWITSLTIVVTAIAIIISIVSYLNARKASKIAKSSDLKMQALTDLNFDEKLAVMKGYKKGARRDISVEGFEGMRKNLEAVANLERYAAKDKSNELIGDVMRILKDNLQEIDEENIDVVDKIIRTVKKFAIYEDYKTRFEVIEEAIYRRVYKVENE